MPFTVCDSHPNRTMHPLSRHALEVLALLSVVRSGYRETIDTMGKGNNTHTHTHKC